ncbi:class I SAM-dependent methyltransferase [Halomicrococcus gelatinilyticus]|uniref:class I SAM-dependent methyltransferase n=1 Tax=Halomicrococcus gelatinilyticus TaxID=1702103 RepID=UPI002E102C2F
MTDDSSAGDDSSASSDSTPPEPRAYSFERYLDAKHTVDDRALDRRVLDRFAHELPAPARVLEVGAGTGAMVERLLDWGRLPDEVHYTAVDVDGTSLATARDRLRERGFEPRVPVPDGHEAAVLAADGATVEFAAADAVEFARVTDRRWDAVVGHAVLDLLDLDEAIPALCGVVPGGLAYFTVTFDAETAFEPSRPLDDRVVARYHERMDDGDGSSRAGRRLLARLPAHGARVLAAGGSDWVVHPQDGGYPADEAYFLHHLVRTVEDALADDPAVDGDELAEWAAARHRAVADGELVAVAHNLDVLARVPE